MEEKDKLICKQVALKTAVEICKDKAVLNYKEFITDIADYYYEWLTKDFKPKNLIK